MEIKADSQYKKARMDDPVWRLAHFGNAPQLPLLLCDFDF
jgi:hypothetical protein